MSKLILVSVDLLESRAAIVEDDALAEIYVARKERRVGSIYKGRVVNVLPGMQAAFVDIGLERNAFLCLDDAVFKLAHEEEVSPDEIKEVSIQDLLRTKQEILVQVIKEPIGSKGARVSSHITLPGRYLVLLPQASYIGVSRRIEQPVERERLKGLIETIRPAGTGIIVRTVAEGKDKDVISQDLSAMMKLWDRIQRLGSKVGAPALIHQELSLVFRVVRDVLSEDVDRMILDSHTEYERVLELVDVIAPELRSRIVLYEGKRPLFDLHGVEQEIEKALKKRVWLPSGGYLIIEQTEAFAVIDVNTGRFVGSNNLPETILQTNLEAASEIAKQLRLRDIGGIITVDFIDMEEPEDREKVLLRLQEAVKKDRTKSHILGMSQLGLVEMTRKRVSKSLEGILREDCPYCGGRGRVLSLETMTIKLEREIRRLSLDSKGDAVLVMANPQVLVQVAGWEGERVEELEQEIGKAIFLRVAENQHVERYQITLDALKRIEEKVHQLRSGEEISVEIREVHPIGIQSGLTRIEGQLVEVKGAGNMVGARVKAVVVEATHSYVIAELL
ncbi:MAG: Rne/Rng family ribonuclease [Armatimonadetes bacterium]|nr:Rne/Rng family ribonuclease [Armatimonadota bacterium]